MRDSFFGLCGLGQTALSRDWELPSLISPDQCILLSLPLSRDKFMDLWAGEQPLAPFSQQESSEWQLVPSTVVELQDVVTCDGVPDPQSFTLGWSPLCEGGWGCQQEVASWVGAPVPRAEGLPSDPRFATGATGKSGNHPEPHLPHPQSWDGTNMCFQNEVLGGGHM